MKMLNGVKWSISLLAILVGGIGIINTMIMSIFERIRKISVSKSLGWSNRRIIGMILGESIVITLIAGIIGSIVGFILIQIIIDTGMLDDVVPVLPNQYIFRNNSNISNSWNYWEDISCN